MVLVNIQRGSNGGENFTSAFLFFHLTGDRWGLLQATIRGDPAFGEMGKDGHRKNSGEHTF